MTSSRPSLYDSFALYASGLTLITVRDGSDDQFFVAGSVLTASVEPFTLALSAWKDRFGVPAITRGAPWAVSVLAAGQRHIVHRLTAPGTNAERLDALREAGAVTSPEGPLWLPDALVTLWCGTHSVTPVHDQLVIVGTVERGSPHRDGEPLLRWNRDYRTVTGLRSYQSSR